MEQYWSKMALPLRMLQMEDFFKWGLWQSSRGRVKKRLSAGRKQLVASRTEDSTGEGPGLWVRLDRPVRGFLLSSP